MDEAPITLENLHEEFDDNAPLPDADNVRDLVDELHDEWSDPGVTLDDWVAWACSRFALGDEVTYDKLHGGFMRRWFQYKHLMKLAIAVNVAEEAGTIDKLDAIRYIMHRSRKACTAVMVGFDSMRETRKCLIPPKMVEDDQETFESHDAESLSSFQRLLLIMCDRLQARRLRKCGDSCFSRIVTEYGYDTRTYEFCSTVKAEVYQIQKEIDFKEWRFLTNPRDNPRAVAEHLVESEQREFQTLDVGDGDYYAFEDGIYDIQHDLFFTYTDEATWRQYADEMSRARSSELKYPIPNNSTACINYFPIMFKFDISPRVPELSNPMSIQTPGFDKILDAQGFDYETKKWTFVLTGRLFFLVNRFDRWSRAWFIVGAGGTGKSTIANWIMHAIPSHFHSILNSNFEEQFGMSGIALDEKRCCLCTELTEDLRYKQEEFQICVEGGTLQVAVKGATSRPHKFRQHMLFIGNQFPRRWKNNAKQVSRRVILQKFSRPVSKDKLQGDLLEELVAETDAILRKSTLMYMRAAKQYGNVDLEAPGVLPEAMVAFMKTLETSMDPLTMFLASEQLTIRADVYMPLTDFKRDYFEFRKANGFSSVGWTRDHYETTFLTMGISPVPVRVSRMFREEMRTTDWINGICATEDVQALVAMPLVEDDD